MKVTVMCDACGGLVNGSITHADGFTGGFYLRGWLILPQRGATQDKVFPEGKDILCDYCMQSSDEYKAIYGNKAAMVALRAPARMPKAGEKVRTYDELLWFIEKGEFA